MICILIQYLIGFLRIVAGFGRDENKTPRRKRRGVEYVLQVAGPVSGDEKLNPEQ